ncbi:hypothetical protein TrCOL_g1099 [Triparma columacea]|uniref:Uncharacterized protein n=1 Tax=Triparma columacea TaxID=722753 RepID=A0A9W7FZL9_9STRA|nr:hypothetical protein TrCOL_g1099 [Triparma columacea]
MASFLAMRGEEDEMPELPPSLPDTHPITSTISPPEPPKQLPSSREVSTKRVSPDPPSATQLHPDNDPASSRIVKNNANNFLRTRLRFPSFLARFFTCNITPDEPWEWISTNLQVSQVHVKALKFMILTYGLIWIIRQYVKEDKAMEIDDEWRHDEFMAYFFLPSLLDVMSFFTIGRLFIRQGTDNFMFAFPCTLGAFFMSWLGLIPALNTSFKKDSIEGWTADTWIPIAILFSLLFIVVIFHIYSAYKEKILVGRVLEIVVMSLLVLKPIASRESFHPHHWFLAWLFGCHANQRFWWSIALQGFLWGIYINGVAVYGRDGLLGCQEDKFRTLDDGCPWSSSIPEDDDF